METPKPIHSLVLDTGPIIKNDPSVSTLLAQAENLYTIPAVIEEIRDEVTRSRVETTLRPFITLISPKPASIKVITDFARRTGDLEVLSRPDIHVIALAYELECERNHGDWRLRSTPGQKRVNGPPPASLIAEGRAEPPKEASTISQEPANENNGAPETEPEESLEVPTQSGEASQESVTSIEESLKATKLSDAKTPSELEQESLPEQSIKEAVSNTGGNDSEETSVVPPFQNEDSTIEPIVEAEEVEAEESEASDGGGWITPSNLKKHQAKDMTGSGKPQKEPKIMQVAVMTSDFAMQNVVLRMNLNLLSSSLQRISQVKTWVLRCHACFGITKDMNKQFCDRCGKPTLIRASCSTDRDGNFKVHLKKNMQWNTRGNVFSIPKPVAGTSSGKVAPGGGKGGWGQRLILTGDQKEYMQAMTVEKRKKEKDLMDEDYLPSILTGDRGRAGGRPKVGAGRNVNGKKGR